MVKSLSMFFHSLYWYHKSMKTKPLKAIRQTRRLQKNYIMLRIDLVLNFEKIGRRFWKQQKNIDKQSVKTDSWAVLHANRPAKNLLQKRGVGRHFRKGGNIPSRGSPQADFETEIVAKGQQWQHGIRMEDKWVNAFARDVHFVKFNVSIKKSIVKILEWGGVGWQEKWSMQSVWQSFAGFTARGVLQNQSFDIQRGN